jgi:hypothetical protein
MAQPVEKDFSNLLIPCYTILVKKCEREVRNIHRSKEMDMDADEDAATKERRLRLRQEYGWLYDTVLQLLFDYDPASVNFETNPDEYAPEVGTILPRLREATSPTALSRIIHEEFVRWFSPSIAARKASSYDRVAEAIWTEWVRWLEEHKQR